MTANRQLRNACAAALMFGALPYAAQAQVRTWQAGTGVLAEGFAFRNPSAVGIDAVILLTTPLAVRFAGPVNIEATGAYARATLIDAAGNYSTLEGFTDTSIRMTVPLANERVTLSSSVYLPTGKASQTAKEARVASVIAADLLPFRITNWGSNGGFDISGAFAVPLGQFGVGARLGFSAAREFAPLVGGPDVFRYHPGNQLYAIIAVDRPVGATGKLAISATLQRFDEDSFDGQNLYRSGDRLDILGTLDIGAGGSARASMYGGVLHRSESAFLDGSQILAAQDLIVTGASLRLPLERAVFLPATDLRVFRSADGLGQGYLLGLGTSVELQFRDALLIPTMRVRLGSVVVNQQTRSAMVGVETGLTLRLGRPR